MNNISRALLPMAERAPVLSYESVTATGTAAADAGQGGGAAAAPASGGVTGIIIDGSGLGLRPAMSPRILNQSGTVLYGPGQYDRDYAAANGVVGYAKTLGQAKADTRVQGNPLVLRGASASGTAKTDVIISNADAGKLVSAGRSAGLLQDCRIMFVLN